MLILADMDGTLFPSRMMREMQGKELDEKAYLSFYKLLTSGSEIIPVTGRTFVAYERACDRLQGLNVSEYAVISHGALILKAGQVSKDWLHHIQSEIEPAQKSMRRIVSAVEGIQENLGQELTIRLLEDQGVPCYVSIKSADRSGIMGVKDQILNHLYGQRILPDTFDVHINEDNIAFKPAYACKKRACEFLLNHFDINREGKMLVGAGDSLSDFPFMDLCDFMLVPPDSQIRDELNKNL